MAVPDKTGSCVQIPSQLPGDKIPPTAKIKTYPVQDFNKWVWVYIGEAEKANEVQPTDIPEMNEWPFTYKAYTIKADLETTAESLIDPRLSRFLQTILQPSQSFEKS